MELAEKLISRSWINSNGCWIWPGATTDFGHGLLTYKRKHILTHRASYEVFRGEIPDGLLVCHTCDVPQCIYPLHLFLGTHQDNTQDAKSKGRLARGNRHYAAKINEGIAREIIARYESGERPSELAEEYNLSPNYVTEIVRGRKWSWLPRNTKERIKPPSLLSGESSPNAKMTQEKVAEIRHARLSGEKNISIARRFGISTAQASRICSGAAWKHGKDSANA